MLQEFFDIGYAVEQYIDGELFVRMTELYYEDLGEYIIQHPKELCRDYWKRLVDDTRECDIMGFIKKLCETHITIKKLTKDKVDFCTELLEDIEGET